MTIYQRGEHYVHHVTIKDRNNTKVDPADVAIAIYDPCKRQMTNYTTGSMGKSGTGEYYYNWFIPSAATYGRYSTQVRARSSTPTTTYITGEFFVMPWDVSTDVKQITGIVDEKSISDKDLESVCWMSYQRALKEVYMHHYGETPNPNVNNGQLFNGSNVYFQTKHFPIADSNGDGAITGNVTSCATDVEGWWIKNDGSRERLDITITHTENGTLEIYQSDGVTPIPSDNEGVYLNYYSRYESYSEEIFRQAVAHLAAHYINLRLKEVDRVTIADLQSNAQIVIKNDRRFFYEYKRLMTLIRRPMCTTM